MNRLPLISTFLLFAGCASLLQTHALPTADFLTLSEVRDTSYLAGRSYGNPFSTNFYRIRDSAFHAVTIDPIYAKPLYDLDSNRALDSLDEISSLRYTRLKHTLTDQYSILKGSNQ